VVNQVNDDYFKSGGVPLPEEGRSAKVLENGKNQNK
jgi:hypothetical protein